MINRNICKIFFVIVNHYILVCIPMYHTVLTNWTVTCTCSHVIFILRRFWMSIFFQWCSMKILHLQGNRWWHSVLQTQESTGVPKQKYNLMFNFFFPSIQMRGWLPYGSLGFLEARWYCHRRTIQFQTRMSALWDTSLWSPCCRQIEAMWWHPTNPKV